MKITYLLGAGASIQAVPVVNQTEGSLMTMVTNILNCTKDDLGTARAELMEDLTELRKNIGNYASIDTYAKKIFLTNDKEFASLQRLLIVYILYWQIKRPLDKRYDLLIASIIHIGTDKSYFYLPSDFNIITWNYDLQFEIAYSKYKGIKTLEGVFKELQVRPRPGQFDYREPMAKDKFSILKLNGCAGFHTYNQNILSADKVEIDRLFDTSDPEKFIVQYYEKLKRINAPELFHIFYFAWELSSSMGATAFAAQDFDTEILVIIGYSFPQFNRDVDRRIIGNMPKIKKIYYQDPNPQKDTLSKSIFNPEQVIKFKRGEIKIEFISDESAMNRFFIPYEV